MRPRQRSGDRGASLAELLVVMALMGLIGTMVMSVSVQVAKALRGAAERSDDSQDARVALEAMTRALRSAVDPDEDGPLTAFVDAGGHPELGSTPFQVGFFSAYQQDVEADVDGSTTTTTEPARYRIWLQQEPDPATGEAQWVLRQRIWPWPGTRDSLGHPTWPAPTDLATARERVLARNLAVGGATDQPLFRYFTATRSTELADYGRATGVAAVVTPTGATPATGTALSAAEAADIRAVDLWLRPVRSSGVGNRPVTTQTRVTVENNPEVRK